MRRNEKKLSKKPRDQFSCIFNVSKIGESEKIAKNAPAEITALEYAPMSSADVDGVFNQSRNIFLQNSYNFRFR